MSVAKKYPGDWTQIESPDHIVQLMEVFGGFHDGCVREVHVATGHSVDENLSMTCDWRTTAHILIQRQRRDPSAIEIRFEEVVQINVCAPPPDYVCIIWQAELLLRDGIYHWSEDAAWGPDSPRHNETTWIAARHVWWRDSSHFMGDQLRYKL